MGQTLSLGQQAAAGLAATLMLALATPAGAQQADTLPFRAGQWGAEFTASNFSVEFSASVFAEVGAQWLISPNLWLGATWSANLQAGRAVIERFSASGIGEPERAQTGVNTLNATLGALAIRGTVYF